MTVLTKPSLLIQKADITRIPVVQAAAYDEECLDVELPPPAPKRRSQQPSALFFLAVLALLVLSAGFLCGTELYAQYMRSARPTVMRFQGFCSIPVDTQAIEEEQLIEPYYRVTPLRFYQSPDEEATTTEANEFANEGDMDALREEFDIGDSVEKISVFNGPNGRQTSFIHDFFYNISGIVDEQRCFVMGLDRARVLPPAVFIMSIEGGSAFDVTRVRDSLRALLPPLASFPGAMGRALPQLCAGRPTYRLERDDTIIRKRSVGGALAPADYSQWAGRRVQDIHIPNMPQLLAYEARTRGQKR